MNFPVNPEKATAAVARLIEQSGNDVDYLRVVKLVYLADRESLLSRGMPIVGGKLFSMRKGPANGDVMTFVNCQTAPGWKGLISPRHGTKLKLEHAPSYGALSVSELDILDRVVSEHAARSTHQLVDWCHSNCAEYEHVFLGRRDISIESILEAGGKSPEKIRKIIQDAEDIEDLNALLA